MAGNIIPNNSGAILSIKYGFPTFLTTHDVRFGFSLIGVWLVILNFQAMQTKPWPNYLIGLGFFAGIIMILGLAVNLPLEFIILYPVWCIWLGSHILKKAGKDNQ
jgi:hypothetical protein